MTDATPQLPDEAAIKALRDWWYSDKRALTKSSMEHAKDIVSMLDRAGYVIVRKCYPAAPAETQEP